MKCYAIHSTRINYALLKILKESMPTIRETAITITPAPVWYNKYLIIIDPLKYYGESYLCTTHKQIIKILSKLQHHKKPLFTEATLPRMLQYYTHLIVTGFLQHIGLPYTYLPHATQYISFSLPEEILQFNYTKITELAALPYNLLPHKGTQILTQIANDIKQRLAHAAPFSSFSISSLPGAIQLLVYYNQQFPEDKQYHPWQEAIAHVLPTDYQTIKVVTPPITEEKYYVFYYKEQEYHIRLVVPEKQPSKYIQLINNTHIIYYPSLYK